jgi:hypothetical protein
MYKQAKESKDSAHLFHIQTVLLPPKLFLPLGQDEQIHTAGTPPSSLTRPLLCINFECAQFGVHTNHPHQTRPQIIPG